MPAATARDASGNNLLEWSTLASSVGPMEHGRMGTPPGSELAQMSPGEGHPPQQR
jgi:hypothetical protein